MSHSPPSLFGAVVHHCCWCDMLMSPRHRETTWVLATSQAIKDVVELGQFSYFCADATIGHHSSPFCNGHVVLPVLEWCNNGGHQTVGVGCCLSTRFNTLLFGIYFGRLPSLSHSPPPLSFFVTFCEVFVAVLHHCCWCDMLMSQRHVESTWVWAFLRSTYVHVFQHFTRFISSLHVILATRKTIFEHHLRFHCTCVIYRIPGCSGSLLCTICGQIFCRHGSPPQ